MKNSNKTAEEKILNEKEESGTKNNAPSSDDSETSEDCIDCEAKQDPEQKEDEELQTKYLRLAADFQNYRRRVDKEKNDIYAFANEKIMVELLNVIDNFDRALAVDTADTGMKEGMAMILKQLIDVLEKSGLEEITACGQEFDPNFHHAVQTAKSEVHGSGRIATVLQKGYMLNKKVIRPSMVIVAE